jgi:hypothetical protein
VTGFYIAIVPDDPLTKNLSRTHFVLFSGVSPCFAADRGCRSFFLRTSVAILTEVITGQSATTLGEFDEHTCRMMKAADL